MLKQSDLDQFVGNCDRYKFFGCIILTPGVRYFVENGGKSEKGTAWWLLDIITSYQGDRRINNNEDLRYLQFWTLKIEGDKGIVTCDDGNNNVFITQEITRPDCCLSEVKIWVGDNGNGTRTAYLPSEH